jgi:sodium-coupled neutral amino acid transporter 11
MPLLVGLLDNAASRRSLDGPFALHANRQGADETQDVDLEELASNRMAGGGMLDSVANMANSILGAGT